MHLNDMLQVMVDKKASDLHLKVGRPPLFRVGGKLYTSEFDRMTSETMDSLVGNLLNEKQIDKFQKELGVDVAYSVPGLARFRANVFMQRGTVAIVMRTIPFHIPTIEELGLPTVLNDLALLNQGLILLTGPTGCGKSTTIAAMVEHINSNLEKQIISIEDPIEFLFRDRKSSIIQREVGTDAISFNDGLKSIFRQDPDVIMIGEMRDFDTMQTAISAAETGHLVLSTLHTNDASQAIDRILDTFPVTQQHQLRVQLSKVLAGIISQRLVRTTDGTGRTAAVEILVNSPLISDLIIEGKTKELSDAIQSSVESYRMQTLEQSLAAMVIHGVITYNEAMAATAKKADVDRAFRQLDPEQF